MDDIEMISYHDGSREAIDDEVIGPTVSENGIPL